MNLNISTLNMIPFEIRQAMALRAIDNIKKKSALIIQKYWRKYYYTTYEADDVATEILEQQYIDKFIDTCFESNDATLCEDITWDSNEDYYLEYSKSCHGNEIVTIHINSDEKIHIHYPTANKNYVRIFNEDYEQIEAERLILIIPSSCLTESKIIGIPEPEYEELIEKFRCPLTRKNTDKLNLLIFTDLNIIKEIAKDPFGSVQRDIYGTKDI